LFVETLSGAQITNLRAWIADLRTNPPQTTGYLKDDYGHCCLGRACEISGISHWQLDTPVQFDYSNLDLIRWTPAIFSYDDCVAILPPEVAKYYGLISDFGAFGEGEWSLTQLNDEGYTFAEIADFIESCLELYLYERILDVMEEARFGAPNE